MVPLDGRTTTDGRDGRTEDDDDGTDDGRTEDRTEDDDGTDDGRRRRATDDDGRTQFNISNTTFRPKSNMQKKQLLLHETHF